MFEQYKQYGECDSTHFCMTQRVMAILSEAGASLPYSRHSFATMCIYCRWLSCGHGTTRRSDWYCTEEHRAPLFTPPTNNPLLTSYFQYGGICTSLTLSYRKGTVQLVAGGYLYYILSNSTNAELFLFSTNVTRTIRPYTVPVVKSVLSVIRVLSSPSGICWLSSFAVVSPLRAFWIFRCIHLSDTRGY